MRTVNKTFDNVSLQYAQRGVDRYGITCMLDVSGMSTGSVSMLHLTGTWATAVVTIKQSNSPAGPWTALSGVSTLTLASPSTGQFSIGYKYIMAEITTGEAAESTASISFSAKE